MKSILIADDEAANRILIRHIISESEYQIIEAENGQVALELTLQHLPDLILLDISMPIMNGWQVAQEIRTQVSSITIIGISSVGCVGIDHNTAEFDELLSKPFDIYHLKQLVNAYLNTKKTPYHRA